jgi:hypothetical protein
MTPLGWLVTFKIYVVWAAIFLIYLLNKKGASAMFFAVVSWLKEGFEDADGKFNAKDIYMGIFSGVLITMIFMDFRVHGEFSTHSWIIIDSLVAGGALTKFVESPQFAQIQKLFGKKHDKTGQ